MAALHPGDKKRVLPSWMTAPGPEKSMWPVQTPKRKRRRTAAVPATARWDTLEPGSSQCWQIREVDGVSVRLRLLGGARAACRRLSELCPPRQTPLPLGESATPR